MKAYDPNSIEVVFGDKKCVGFSEAVATVDERNFKSDVLVIDLKDHYDISKVVVNGVSYTKAQENT